MPVFVINTHVARQWWVKPFIAITRHISVDPTTPHYLKNADPAHPGRRTSGGVPRGRLSLTGALMKIYEGPALAADKADAALLPVYIEGAQWPAVAARWHRPPPSVPAHPPDHVAAAPIERASGASRVRRQQLGRQLTS